MNITEIKDHYEKFQEWLASLHKVDENLWLTPISEGKWSSAAIVAHLLYWDRHSLDERFPAFQQGANLEGFPDFQEVNNSAKEFAHSGITKEQLINDIISERQRYFHLIENLSEADLNIAFTIGNHSLTMEEYFKDFIGHDLHHQKQIIDALVSA